MKTICILTLFLYSLCLFSQENNCFVVRYNFENNINNLPEKENELYVFIDSKKGLHRSYISCKHRGFKTVESTNNTENGSSIERTVYFPLYDSLPYILVKDYEKEIIFHKEQEFGDRTGRSFLYTKEKMTPNTWKILDSVKVIDGVSCYLATIDFRCRKYIAWFAPSIPIYCVPFKLPKLPGLVLEMYSTNKELYYFLSDFEEVDCLLSEKYPMPSEFSNPKIMDWASKKAHSGKLVEKVEARLSGMNFKVKVIECFDE